MITRDTNRLVTPGELVWLLTISNEGGGGQSMSGGGGDLSIYHKVLNLVVNKRRNPFLEPTSAKQ